MILKVINNGRQLQITDVSEIELQQIQLSLRKRIKNAWFHPLVKKKLWDGYIEFIDASLRISSGLWDVVREICDTYSYDLTIEGLDTIIDFNFSEQSFREWVEVFFEGSKLQPRDYQIDAAAKILKWKRSISEIATSAGKTLIMFMVFAYLRETEFLHTFEDEEGNTVKKQIIIIVPNVPLILQTYEKFIQYGAVNKKFKFNVQTFGGGASKIKRNTDVIIGTFQTLRDLPDSYYKNVLAVGVDESHFASSKSIKTVLKKCAYATIRFGVSGTTKANDDTADSYSMQSLLGPMVNKISPQFLFKNNYATPLKIRMLYMDYLPIKTREKLAKLKKKKKEGDGSKVLNIERQLIIESEERFDFIIDTISSIKKNSLVLFHNVKDHYGRRIYERLQEILPNKVAVYYVDGGIDKNLREDYRKAMEYPNKQSIMIASYGTFSTGIDISNLEYIFLVESFKSEVIIKQSFGRGMRLMDGKITTKIIDFIDDFSLPGFENYTLKHSQAREELYIAEGFEYKKSYVSF